jgi:hypothetical protein
MKDRIFENSLSIIRKYLNEEASTNSLSSGKMAGTPEAGDLPPVDLRQRKYKNLPGPFRDLFRRTLSVKPKQHS